MSATRAQPAWTPHAPPLPEARPDPGLIRIWRARSPDPRPSGVRQCAAALRRMVLGTVPGMPSAGPEVELAPGGRPFVPGAAFDFNLSHAGPWVVMALAGGRRIGVDIEQARPRLNMQRLADRFFAADEALALREAENPMALFLRLWTAKEAALKFLGRGLAGGLDRTLPQSPPDGAPQVRLPDGRICHLAWFPVDPLTCGALVWDGSPSPHLDFCEATGPTGAAFGDCFPEGAA